MKKYLIIFSLPVIILILVLIRVFSTGHFKNNALKRAEPSLSMSNMLTADDITSNNRDMLIVNIGEKGNRFSGVGDVVNIPASDILIKENQEILRRYKKGMIVLHSDDAALNSRVWMILSQLGYSNLYILSNDTLNEVMKYKFRPDTSYKPEF